MSITAINPESVRLQSQSKKRTFQTDDFSALVGSTGPAASTVVGQNQGYRPAAVTSAAISGIAGTPQAVQGNAPYYASAASLGTAGYSYAGAVPAGTLPGGTVNSLATGGIPGTPSQDYLEKQKLFQMMNDANWEMLTAQVTVNELSRDYQARSNILKTKSDTEVNAVRNMRA